MNPANKNLSQPADLAGRLAGLLARLAQVRAVALGGSRGGGPGSADSGSDVDLYVYTTAEISLADRQDILRDAGGASAADLGLDYWGPGDEWLDAATGIEVDLVYFDSAWMEGQIERVLARHEPSLGYSTCFWYTARHSVPLFDRGGWFAALQARSQAAYPEPLRRNIIRHNHPVLRGVIPAYARQIEKAVRRGDLVSANHRLAALLASYFDILFALNRQPHPGEKRLAEFATKTCRILPQNFEADLAAVLARDLPALPGLPAAVQRLLDHLDEALAAGGFPPAELAR